jgi:hypothetical protein
MSFLRGCCRYVNQSAQAEEDGDDEDERRETTRKLVNKVGGWIGR